MEKLIFNRKLFFVIPFIIVLSSYLIVNSTAFLAQASALSVGVTLDLVLVLPLVYFLIIRKTKIPKITVVPIFILGLLTASYILPENSQGLLTRVKNWVLPIVEIGVITFIIFKVRHVIKLFKSKNENDIDFFTVLKSVTLEILPKKLSVLLSTEIAVFYYGFINWKAPKLTLNQYTNHKNSSGQALLYALLFIIFVESIAIHLLLVQWSSIAAWILTGLSVYSGFQIFGFARSLNKRPISIDANKKELELRYGILAETNIKITSIISIEETTKEIEKESDIKILSPLGQMDSHNLVINLNQPHKMQGIYGLTKEFESIAINIDEKDVFLSAINKLKVQKKPITM